MPVTSSHRPLWATLESWDETRVTPCWAVADWRCQIAETPGERKTQRTATALGHVLAGLEGGVLFPWLCWLSGHCPLSSPGVLCHGAVLRHRCPLLHSPAGKLSFATLPALQHHLVPPVGTCQPEVTSSGIGLQGGPGRAASCCRSDPSSFSPIYGPCCAEKGPLFIFHQGQFSAVCSWGSTGPYVTALASCPLVSQRSGSSWARADLSQRPTRYDLSRWKQKSLKFPLSPAFLSHQTIRQ